MRQEPYLGVACPQANSIACDRVGLAIWLTDPATRVSATINGERMVLKPGKWRDAARSPWLGYLQPAGLVSGSLKVKPDRGRYFWQGGHPKDARVVITIRRGDGSRNRRRLTIPLRAGWG